MGLIATHCMHLLVSCSRQIRSRLVNLIASSLRFFFSKNFVTLIQHHVLKLTSKIHIFTRQIVLLSKIALFRWRDRFRPGRCINSLCVLFGHNQLFKGSWLLTFIAVFVYFYSRYWRLLHSVIQVTGFNTLMHLPQF
jgi:hypothetical protein